MKFVSEDVIDQVIEDLEQLGEDKYEAQMEAFSEAQPVVIAWLFSEQFDLLTEDERGFMQYLALIAWLAFEKVNGRLEPISEDELGEAEEKNYEVLELSTAKKFRDRLNPFFENTPQEDLLAFAEQAVMEEEGEADAIVTAAGREPIFVAIKTLVDIWCSRNEE